jgi:hypothetical protein
MAGKGRKGHEVTTMLDLVVRRALDAGRREAPTAFGPGAGCARTLWCRLKAGSPCDPPDERYYAEEVRPAGLSAEGHIVWEAVPGGAGDLVVHNTAEAALGTHLLAEGTVAPAEQRLDGGSPPECVQLIHVSVALDRFARIISYSGGGYTVQPVRRGEAGFTDEGAPVVGVPNLGELWDDEAGYLAGPGAYERHVRIYWTPAGWTILLHPPRMV